jgi:hypothetical protein
MKMESLFLILKTIVYAIYLFFSGILKAIISLPLSKMSFFKK